MHRTKKKFPWTWHHVVIFLLTFFGYAFFHACRKSFSNVKDTMAKEFTPTNSSHPVSPYSTWGRRQIFENEKNADVFLGELDTLFLFAYAIGLYISGILGDNLNLRLVLSSGMCLSAVSLFCFGFVSEVAKIYNKYYYGTLYFLTGLLQATGWPTMVAVMGNWFSKRTSGSVFGVWSANASVGNIIGSLMVASVLDYGYEYGMLVTSYLLFCGGILIFCCLIPSPKDIGLPPPDADENKAGDYVTEESKRLIQNSSPSCNDFYQSEVKIVQKSEAFGFLKALLLPGVIPYSLAYACLKLVNYSFFFWLPVYLGQGLHWKDTTSDKLSNFYDVGGIFGGIVAGIISDFIGIRSPVVLSMLVLSVGSLYAYSLAGAHYTTNVALMTLAGFMIGGPANIISSAISADLGKQDAVRGNKEALATVTGIVDGTGSVGAAIGQYLVPVINKKASWHWVFYFLILMTIMSAVCVLPMLYRDIKNEGCPCRKSENDYVVDSD